MGLSRFLRLPMDFHKRLHQHRKQQGMTQQQLSDLVNIHVNQIKRYEAGTALPTLDALVRVAKALHVSLDDLVFSDHERDPDEELKLQFEAVSQMPDEEKSLVKAVVESLVFTHQTRKMVGDLSR